MFKPCPNCGFLVAVIAGREASQRCPRCGSALFDDDEIAQAPEAPSPHHPAVERGARDDRVAAQEAVPAPGPDQDPGDMDQGDRDDDIRVERLPAEALLPAGPAPVAEPPEGQPDQVVDRDAPATPGTPASESPPLEPSFAGRRPPGRAASTPPTHRLRWAVALTVLALVLAVQLLLAQRAELAQQARWRPVVTAACALFRCDVPAWREPERFAMTARNVQPDPRRAGVLHVTATLRNDAEWPQPLPVVVLSLSDVDGRMVGARALAPADYSGDPGRTVAPGESVDLAFDVREPSPTVVAFDFALH